MKNKRILFLIVYCFLFSSCSNLAETPTTTAQVFYLPTRNADLPMTEEERTPQCENQMFFLGDASFPDGTIVDAGKEFIKEWEVLNTGTCEWGENYRLFFISGDQDALQAPSVVAIPKVGAGQKAKISVKLVAPFEPGSYETVWKVFSSENRSFGENMTLEIMVQ